ncbi:L,D-transpeptidase family protein [Actibacterium sp. D379-3]
MTLPRRGDLVVTRWGARYRGRRIPCAIGKGGLAAHKREGDGATPLGVHKIAGMLYRADRIPPPAHGAAPIGPRDLWSDDGDDPAYNHLVRAPHPFRHERLRRADRLYDLVLLTDWNGPDATPGRGSAIFVHRWRKPRHPTEGCIAFAPADLRWIAQTWRPGARIVVLA